LITYRVQFSAAADEDFERLFDFILQREPESASSDLGIPERALQAIKDGIGFLRSSPFACRKVGASPFVRELVITFESTGFVAMYSIDLKDPFERTIVGPK
jgi:hypothetical protein